MKQKIIFSTIKLSGAAILAIFVATQLHLKFALSAGIIAILTVAPTKKETVQTAACRFLAFLIAVLVAFLSFQVFGYRNTGFFVYLIVFIFICQSFGWISAIAMDSVLISHFISADVMNSASILNELVLFLVGSFLEL